MTILRAKPHHAALFEQVAEDVFDEPIVPEYLTRYLADPDAMMVIALVYGVVVGQCRAMAYRNPDQPDDLFIDNLGVAPSHQRRGIARALMAEMMAWAKERGIGSVWVATESDNVPARTLYTGFGAEAVEMVYFEYKL